MAEYSLWDVLRYHLEQSVSHCRRERELNISSPATVCQEDRNSSYTDILRKLFLILPCPSLHSPTKQRESFKDLPPPTSIHTAKSNLRCWFGSQSSPPQPHHDSGLRMREVFSRLIFLYLSTATLLLFCNRIFPPSPIAFPGHSITLRVPDDTPPILKSNLEK